MTAETIGAACDVPLFIVVPDEEKASELTIWSPGAKRWTDVLPKFEKEATPPAELVAPTEIIPETKY